MLNMRSMSVVAPVNTVPTPVNRSCPVRPNSRRVQASNVHTAGEGDAGAWGSTPRGAAGAGPDTRPTSLSTGSGAAAVTSAELSGRGSAAAAVSALCAGGSGDADSVYSADSRAVSGDDT